MRQPFGTELAAGDTWTWPICDVGYDLTVWTVKYFLRGAKKLDLAMEADGVGGYQLKAAAIDTAKLTAGDYSWVLVVTKDSDRVELARGLVKIKPDIAAADENFDGRSFAKKMLDAVRAVMEGRATRVEKSYQFNGKALELQTMSELRAAEKDYAQQVRNEQIASGQIAPTRVVGRFC
jgi:hypothetical protein